MKRIFQQGKWVDERYIDWDHTYDISTKIQAIAIGLGAFELFLSVYYKNGVDLPCKEEYTLAEHCAPGGWTWRGGEGSGPTPGNKQEESAWRHFHSEKESTEKYRRELNAAYAAFRRGDGEACLAYLDGFDDDLCFQVVELDDEFVTPKFRAWDDEEDEWDDEDVD